jgi:hypothetical protein
MDPSITHALTTAAYLQASQLPVPQQPLDYYASGSPNRPRDKGLATPTDTQDVVVVVLGRPPLELAARTVLA